MVITISSTGLWMVERVGSESSPGQNFSSPSLASASPHMEAVTQLKVIQVFLASNQLHTSEQRKTTISFPNFNSTVIWLKYRFSNIISYHCTKLEEKKN